jgi:NADH-quinone oxidoreductase subunit A
MLETLNQPLVKEVSSFFVIPFIILLILIATVWLLKLVLTPRRDVLEVERLRYERYEAGNPPWRRETAKTRMPMQYLGYLIIFLAVEPAVVLFALALAAPKALAGALGKLYLIFIAVYTPLLYYAIKEARDVRKWFLS